MEFPNSNHIEDLGTDGASFDESEIGDEHDVDGPGQEVISNYVEVVHKYSEHARVSYMVQYPSTITDDHNKLLMELQKSGIVDLTKSKSFNIVIHHNEPTPVVDQSGSMSDDDDSGDPELTEGSVPTETSSHT